ncbi:hypothetical protein [Maritalea myrionectae]|uniref:hypothetical protein n=1 Tax=Maritalea myrionectae TaxID=454601 RepID=UPI0004130B6E|nr:hypothetical protein [Maritalea myrionectae]
MGELFERLMAPLHKRVGINDALSGKPPSIIKDIAGGEHARLYHEGYQIGLQMRQIQALEKDNKT